AVPPTATATNTTVPPTATATPTPDSGEPVPPERVEAADDALAWMSLLQDDNGSVGPQGPHIDSVIAFAARGIPVTEWPTSSTGATMVDYLESIAPTYARSASTTGKLIAGIVAAGENPRNFAGVNFVSRLNGYYNPTTGQFDGSFWDSEWGILGWHAAGEPIPDAARQAYADEALPSGCFAGFGGIATGDDVGMALMALAAAGEPLDSSVIQDAIDCARDTLWADNGGFIDGMDQANTKSTALMIMGLQAVGEDPSSAAWTIGTPPINPYNFILNLQQSDGSIWWAPGTPGSPLLSTHQAIPALVSQPYSEMPYSGIALATRSRAQGATMPVTPSEQAGSELTPANANGCQVQGALVYIPASAVQDEADLHCNVLEQPSYALPDATVALRSFTVAVTTWPDNESVTELDRDLLVQVAYDPMELETQGIDLTSLQLVAWNVATSTWDVVPTDYDVATSQLTGRSNYLTEFALLGTPVEQTTDPEQGPHIIYLPFVSR
ncbi:MAG: hypothetical protein HC837_17595, partial [Chloroflexaceae bacterium]|nr:hypothetical protein [Chloroflexaceae bacterium]